MKLAIHALRLVILIALVAFLMKVLSDAGMVVIAAAIGIVSAAVLGALVTAVAIALFKGATKPTK